MTHKISIIRELEQKITLLESSIGRPNSCQASVRNIEQEINLHFRNYY
jgi:hypothetical protein